MYRLIRPWLFRRDAEAAHEAMIRRLARWRHGAGLTRALLAVDDPRLEVSAFGLRFPHPVGLAAGLDKHGEALPAWPALGFAFVEVGTVTPRPQAGSPRPRLFRLVRERAIINRMGFNSQGAEVVAARLGALGGRSIPLGINVGKNRDTPNDEAAADYGSAIAALVEVADYFVINVSSPNTVGLRELQATEALGRLVAAAVGAARRGDGRAVPVLVKLAPDLDDGALVDSAQAAVDAGAGGLVATNTTLSRRGVEGNPLAAEAGGLSGRPLAARSLACVRLLFRAVGGKVPILGVGGISTPEDAYSRIRAGASLIQVYSALIYEGPTLPHRLARGLLRLLDRDHLARIGDAVGADG